MQTKIEQINTDNINEVIELSIEQFGEESWSSAQFYDCLTNKNYLAFLLRYGDKPVAFLLANNLIDSINLLLIATGKEYKNKGFATILIQHLFNIAKKNSVKVWLEVKKTNLSAINLYKKLGFNLLYERMKYYDDGNSALIFEKRHLDIL